MAETFGTEPNQQLVRHLADELCARLTAGDNVRGFLEAARKVESHPAEYRANTLLHDLDELFHDGGMYRCERLVDPAGEYLIDTGQCTVRDVLENAAGLDEAHAAVFLALETLEDTR